MPKSKKSRKINRTSSNQSLLERAREAELERRFEIAEEQEQELEALEAIYGEELVLREDLESYGFPRVFEIKVVPHPGELSKNYCFVIFRMYLSRDYPYSDPNFEFAENSGIANDDLERLSDDLKRACHEMLGSPLAYELIIMIQEFLVVRNKPALSVYDQMIQEKKTQNADKPTLENSPFEEKILEIDESTFQEEEKLRSEWLENRKENNAQIKTQDDSSNIKNQDDEILQNLRELMKSFTREEVFYAHIFRKLHSLLNSDPSLATVSVSPASLISLFYPDNRPPIISERVLNALSLNEDEFLDLFNQIFEREIKEYCKSVFSFLIKSS